MTLLETFVAGSIFMETGTLAAEARVVRAAQTARRRAFIMVVTMGSGKVRKGRVVEGEEEEEELEGSKHGWNRWWAIIL